MFHGHIDAQRIQLLDRRPATAPACSAPMHFILEFFSTTSVQFLIPSGTSPKRYGALVLVASGNLLVHTSPALYKRIKVSFLLWPLDD